jgi:hypothetical protein
MPEYRRAEYSRTAGQQDSRTVVLRTSVLRTRVQECRKPGYSSTAVQQYSRAQNQSVRKLGNREPETARNS